MTYEEKDAICHYIAKEMIIPTCDISPNAFNMLTTKFHSFCGFLNEMVDNSEKK